MTGFELAYLIGAIAAALAFVATMLYVTTKAG
jgi:hypothetical protein